MKKKYGSHSIDISNEEKLLFPNDNITKGALIKYYEKISQTILLHLKDRPITMHRFPNGINKKGFIQQNVSDYFPKWIPTIRVKKKKGTISHVMCQNKATLVYLANQACITTHVWLSKKNSLNRPDKLIFDLDPPNDDFEIVKFAAKKTKELLDELKLDSFVMTTGSSGLHVVVPIKDVTFDESRTFARNVAKVLEKKHKEKFTTKHRKEKRRNRLFIDYLRNSYGQTSVAPYSLRPIDGAPVATPLDWKELDKKQMNSKYYNINNIFKRLKNKSDPWIKLYRHSKSLREARKILQKK